MREFLANLANSEWLALDDVTSEFGFENTHARAFYIRSRLKEREKRVFSDHPRDNHGGEER